MVMAEVRTDHDQGFITSPELFEHCSDLPCFGLADDERHEREGIECFLQEWQVHLEAVFEQMRAVEPFDTGKSPDRLLVDGNPAERCFEPGCGRCSNPPKTDTVIRTNQYDALYPVAIFCECCIGSCRDRP